MKTLLITALAILTLSTSLPVLGQEHRYRGTDEELKAYRESVVREAEFIIEATRLRSDQYYAENPDRFFFSSTFVINKILRGVDELQYGTIQTAKEYEEGFRIKENTTYYPEANHTAIFFCRRAEADIPPTPGLQTDNDTRLEVIESIPIGGSRYWSDRERTVNRHFVLKEFENTGELYDYLLQFDNITIPESQNPYYDINVDSLFNKSTGLLPALIVANAFSFTTNHYYL